MWPHTAALGQITAASSENMAWNWSVPPLAASQSAEEFLSLAGVFWLLLQISVTVITSNTCENICFRIMQNHTCQCSRLFGS